MEPAHLRPVDLLVQRFDAEFKAVEKSYEDYKDLLYLQRPSGGVVRSTTFLQLSEGQLALDTKVKLKAMNALLIQIKDLIPKKSVGDKIVGVFSKNPNDTLVKRLEELIEKVKRMESSWIHALREALYNDPGKLIYDEHGFQPAKMRGIPDIYECHSTVQLTRKQSDLRDRFSERLVKELQMLKPLQDTVQKVTFCSVGSGGCFHELDIHSRFIYRSLYCTNNTEEAKAQIRNFKITWILIDPIYKNNEQTPEMFEFLAEVIHPSVVVETYTRIEDYFKLPNAEPDVIMAIDFESNGKAIDVQPLRDKQKELAAKGHKCVLGILDKWKPKNERIEVNTL